MIDNFDNQLPLSSFLSKQSYQVFFSTRVKIRTRHTVKRLLDTGAVQKLFHILYLQPRWQVQFKPLEDPQVKLPLKMLSLYTFTSSHIPALDTFTHIHGLVSLRTLTWTSYSDVIHWQGHPWHLFDRTKNSIISLPSRTGDIYTATAVHSTPRCLWPKRNDSTWFRKKQFHFAVLYCIQEPKSQPQSDQFQ